MADHIELTVSINEDSAVDSESSIKDKVKNSSDTPSDVSKLNKQAKKTMDENKVKEEDGINGKAVKSFIMNQVIKEAANTTIRIVEESATQQFKYSGNSAALNSLNNKISQVKFGVSVGTSIAGYTAAGAAMGGPWGAAIGAAVGTVYTLVDTMITYNTNNAQLQWDLQNQRLQAQAEANRLGIAAAGRGRIPFQDFKL